MPDSIAQLDKRLEVSVDLHDPAEVVAHLRRRVEEKDYQLQGGRKASARALDEVEDGHGNRSARMGTQTVQQHRGHLLLDDLIDVVHVHDGCHGDAPIEDIPAQLGDVVLRTVGTTAAELSVVPAAGILHVVDVRAPVHGSEDLVPSFEQVVDGRVRIDDLVLRH